MSIAFIDLKAQYRRIKEDVNTRMQKVLEHGEFIMGPEVAELERALAVFTGAKHCIGVASGTDALLMTLMAHEIGPGDAVFLPSFTFTATAEVVVLLGATPVFVDVTEQSYNLDLASLEAQLRHVRATGNLRPRAVIAVDLFGLPADYPRLRDFARNNALVLIADAAQSLGAVAQERRVGAMADMTATSFFPAKPLGCYGDGGAIFCDDDEEADRLRSIRLHGKGKEKYDIVRIGVNGRLDTLQAAVLLAKLAHFPQELEARERIARRYDELLKGAVTLPPRHAGAQSAWAQYTIRLDNRDAVAAALRSQGIPTAVYYPLPMHLQTAYRRFGRDPGSLPVSERLRHEVLSLPMHPYLDDSSIERICSALLAAVGHGKNVA